MKSLPLSALANANFLLAERKGAPLYNPWLLVLCHQAGFQPRAVQEAGQTVTVLNYVAAGLGVTILPAQFRQTATAGVSFIPRPSIATARPGFPGTGILNCSILSIRQGRWAV